MLCAFIRYVVCIYDHILSNDSDIAQSNVGLSVPHQGVCTPSGTQVQHRRTHMNLVSYDLLRSYNLLPGHHVDVAGQPQVGVVSLVLIPEGWRVLS